MMPAQKADLNINGCFDERKGPNPQRVVVAQAVGWHRRLRSGGPEGKRTSFSLKKKGKS
jgi:hypothetical protein